MHKIRAVVFDWAGTMVDFGARAQTGAILRAFAEFGVSIGAAEARKMTGLSSREQLVTLLTDPQVAARWQAVRGVLPDKAASGHLLEAFDTAMAAAATDHAALVPGALETVQWLRKQGIRIGSTTGYGRAIMDRIAPAAAALGYRPDVIVCADDLPEGRPSPLMMYKCFTDLAVHPPKAVIKVDHSEPGIAEGRAAGCITVGVTLSGSEAGLSLAEMTALPEARRNEIRRRARARLKAAGADHVIDSVADLPSLIQTFDARESV